MKKNQIRKFKDYAKVYIKDKSGKHTHTIIDLEDVEKVSKYYWYLRDDGYVYSDEVGYMHYFIMGYIRF